MSDLQEKIINKIGLEFGWNSSESSLREFADELIKLVQKDERQRCIDAVALALIGQPDCAMIALKALEKQ